MLSLKNIFTIILWLLIFIMILIYGCMIFRYFKSKNYRVGRLLNCIFLKEDYNKYLNEIDFCLELDLIKETKREIEQNAIYILSDKGFEYMNSQNSLYLALVAMCISIFMFILSLISLLLK